MVSGETAPFVHRADERRLQVVGLSTRIGTTHPRDRVSVFAESSWIATDRPAAVTGSVAPGDSYKFQFNLHAPADAGTYFEYFGVVEDGVAWFSNPGQGGPADDDLEVQIVVVAAPATADAGTVDSGEQAGGNSGSGERRRKRERKRRRGRWGAGITAGGRVRGRRRRNSGRGSHERSRARGRVVGGCAVTGTRQTSGAGGAIALVVGAILARRKRWSCRRSETVRPLSACIAPHSSTGPAARAT